MSNHANPQEQLKPIKSELDNLAGFLDVLIQIDLANKEKKQIENNVK